MKKIKKVLGLGLAISLLAMNLSACGTPAANNDKFYIGGIGPVTGGAAVYGQHVKISAEIAVKEINEAGGINGKLIEFKFEDDEHDQEKSVNAYNSLKDRV